MTLTFELDLNGVKINKLARQLSRTSFIVQRLLFGNTDRHTLDQLLYMDH